jgi:ABC transporter transmembrane region
LAVCRFITSFWAFGTAFLRGQIRNEYSFDMYHPNGTKKTRDELEEEALEQPFGRCFRTYVFREAFATEFVALLTTLLSVAKCLIRLNIEIGAKRDEEPIHPLFWGAILFASVVSALEMSSVDSVCVRLGEWGHVDLEQTDGPQSLLRQFSSNLSLPLLANDGLQGNNDANEEGGGIDESATPTSNADPDTIVGVSDIGGDAGYKASWSDLIKLCAPDSILIFVAFIFLLLAAAAQIYIPKFTGAILDALEEAYSSNDDDSPNDINDDHSGGDNINTVPGFMSNVKKLIIVSILGGVFSGVRGSIFTVVGGRVNVRLRLRLMDSLLTLEQGFYDVTKTGDITSRLSSDTTLVGDQVTLNVNVSEKKIVGQGAVEGIRQYNKLTLHLSPLAF